MQKATRVSELQILRLAAKARAACSMSGHLHKRSLDSGKWQQRFFLLYQNLLFYFDNEKCERPSCLTLLEGTYCEKFLAGNRIDKATQQQQQQQQQLCFSIFYKKDCQRQLDLRADSEHECQEWVDAINSGSYGKLQEAKEELQQKHLHLMQIFDSERQSKWNYVQQTEELSIEVSKLRVEVRELKEARRERSLSREENEENEELRKIKKVQSFFRGWLCRRRWKQIVEEYIKSEHAEHMRRRNAIVFGLVACEEEYVQQLSILVSGFLRPCKMAASAKKPIITHEDVNSIFLNAETVLFLHQIFLQGLNSKMDNWPTLQLGDLFDMLLPMLGIYQEYVRNHHYSLQVLAEYKQKVEFAALLKRYEEKSVCENRSLETFLTYPMHQIPRYILTLHELLAHTPHDHVDRQQLEFAKGKLEDLSHVMHDEVSETENIRKNLAIERMIVEGCDILLEADQVFVRQGSLTQLLGTSDKAKTAKAVLGSFGSSFNKDSKKEAVRQVFLFTNHMILTSRSNNGRLHLVKNFGKISLSDCTLVEDNAMDFYFGDDEPQAVAAAAADAKVADFNGRDFRLVVDVKGGPAITLTLVANSAQEKAAWCSDINQCIEQIHYSDLLSSTLAETSSVSMPHTISPLGSAVRLATDRRVKSDPKLFRDDFDIKFSRTLNSCKVPQIRHASVERLLDRLTDLRFLSIDFLNTFLLTYRIFTDPKTVICALKRILTNPEFGNLDPRPSVCVQNSVESDGNFAEVGREGGGVGGGGGVGSSLLMPREQDKSRRISTGMMRAEAGAQAAAGQQSAVAAPYRTGSLDASACERLVSKRPTYQPSTPAVSSRREGAEPPEVLRELSDIAEMRRNIVAASSRAPIAACEILAEEPANNTDGEDEKKSRDKLVAKKVRIAGVTESEVSDWMPPILSTDRSARLSGTCTEPQFPLQDPNLRQQDPLQDREPVPQDLPLDRRSLSPLASPRRQRPGSPAGSAVGLATSPMAHSASSPTVSHPQQQLQGQGSWPRSSIVSCASSKRPSYADSQFSEPAGHCSITRSELDSPPCRTRVGIVVTSSRVSKRRCSNTAAALAFATATAGAADCSRLSDRSPKGGTPQHRPSDASAMMKRLSIICTAATMRVLNVVRHWVYKFGEDVEADSQLRADMIDLLEDLVCNQSLFPPDQKAAVQILLRLREAALTEPKMPPEEILTVPPAPSTQTFDCLSALDIAEQITLIDHQLFRAVKSRELMTQAWMKAAKSGQPSTVNLVSRRFNDVSRLVITEIVGRPDAADRAACLEKWAAIADICRCLHNYNGVLQICAAFVNSAVFRLKKTWERLPKTSRQMIDRLQALVSSDCRFKNMRTALHNCDPPCIPYLGMYLTDLSFIEEGTSNVTEGGLINFCKMRMVAHVIREVQQFQQTPYRIERNAKVCEFLLDTRHLLEDEAAYQASLRLEPRLSICPDAAARVKQSA